VSFKCEALAKLENVLLESKEESYLLLGGDLLDPPGLVCQEMLLDTSHQDRASRFLVSSEKEFKDRHREDLSRNKFISAK
jgi:hypothetical protein